MALVGRGQLWNFKLCEGLFPALTQPTLSHDTRINSSNETKLLNPPITRQAKTEHKPFIQTDLGPTRSMYDIRMSVHIFIELIQFW